MARRKLKERNIRKLTRMGGGRSLGLTLPIEFVRKLRVKRNNMPKKKTIKKKINNVVPQPSFIYNSKYYDGTILTQLKPRLIAFKTYKMQDGTLMGLFQGTRGARPDIDFVIKILIPGPNKKLRPPTHTFWVVDLLLKIPQFKDEVREIVQYYIDFYNKTKPFSSVKERDSYKLETVEKITTCYAKLEQPYTLSLDYVATVIELFCKNEKINPGAYMFRDLLLALRDYIDGNKHYTEVLQAAMPGFGNR